MVFEAGWFVEEFHALALALGGRYEPRALPFSASCGAQQQQQGGGAAPAAAPALATARGAAIEAASERSAAGKA